jgi:hypothetical protein
MTTKVLSVLTIVATLLAAAASAEISNQALAQSPEQDEVIVEVIEETFADMPEHIDTMIRIAECESSLTHVEPDGSLVENAEPNSSASGVFQILLITHGQEIERQGLPYDLTELTDHVAYAKHLVRTSIQAGRPFSDWRPSQKCWRSS